MPPYSPYSHSGDTPPSAPSPASLIHPLLAALQVEMEAKDRVIQGLKDSLAKTQKELADYADLFNGIKRDTYHATLSIDRAEYYGSRSRVELSFEVEEGAVAVKWLDAIKEAGK
jgi:hypothetical protein